MNDAMDQQFQPLLQLLDQLSDEFVELRQGVRKAILIADHDPETALTRTRKVLEYIVRDVYDRWCNEKPGTQPLENLLQRRQLGEPLEWYSPDEVIASRITLYHEGSIKDSDERLGEVRAWVMDRLLELKRVFGPRLAELSTRRRAY